MNKKQRTILKGLAKEIDKMCIEHLGRKMTYETVHNTKVTHEDMRLANQDFNEDIDYTFEMPMMHDVNHFRRLKRQLIKYGSDGVLSYLKGCGFAPDQQMLKEALR